jgi:hypothetical protein
VYRKYDRGTTAYSVGLQPGCQTSATMPCVASGFPISQIYTVRNTFTDPVTGITAPYYTATPGSVIPSGLASVTMTNLNYQIYKGLIITANKRFSNRWQLNSSVTIQTNPGYNVFFNNPTGVEFTNGYASRNDFARYSLKVNGAYQLPWGIQVAGNLTVSEGNVRPVTINGPGTVPLGAVNSAGTPQNINYGTLSFQNLGETRFQPIKLLDMGVSKTFALRGGKNRLKVMLDGFNMFNINTITNWSSGNLSTAAFNQPSGIVPPRVVRFGAQFGF